MDWLSIFIPICICLFVHYFWNKHITWWEVCLPMLPAFLIIPSCEYLGESYQTRDTEYLGSHVVEIRYYEQWDEYIHRICYRTIKSGKSTISIPYDCSYVDNHPEYWLAIDSVGNQFDITKDKYKELLIKFGTTPIFVDMERNYHRIDGDMYKVVFTGPRERLEPITTSESYENRVAVSNSTFNFPEVVDKTGLFEYPELSTFKYPSILGPHNYEEQIALNYWNAILGPMKEVRIWLLIFDTPELSKGFDQQAYWKGGNKNEIILCVDKHKRWSHCFSWSEVDSLKIDIRDYSLKHSISDTIEYMGTEIQKRFVRKNFHDFDYLEVETPTWAVIMIYVMVTITSIGVAVYIINNEVDNNEYILFGPKSYFSSTIFNRFSRKNWKNDYRSFTNACKLLLERIISKCRLPKK